MRRWTLERFTEAAKAKYGDRYEYLALDFESKANAQFVGRCSLHGEFSQDVAAHLHKGYGCQKCGNVRKGESKRKTLAEYVSQAQQVHGERYTYKALNYRSRRGFLTIHCPEHGEFEKEVFKHLAGQGCPTCAVAKAASKPKGSKARSFEDWVIAAQRVHGAAYRYLGMATEPGKLPKLRILCPSHGEFAQAAAAHVSGRGCVKCWEDRRGKTLRLTLDDFVPRAREVHGSTYEYLAVVSEPREDAKLLISCPEHGEFAQLAHNHLRGAGCPKCGALRIGLSRRLSLEDFTQKAQAVHGNAYAYLGLTGKPRERTSVLAVCPRHGTFVQDTQNHLSGKGCSACGSLQAGVAQRLSLDAFIEKADAVHDATYAYLGLSDQGLGTNFVRVICQHHGGFWQRTGDHLRGYGCPTCGYGQSSLSQRMRLDEFIVKAESVHGQAYAYLGLTGRTAEKPAQVLAVCARHGGFMQGTNAHLSGNGCPTCHNKITRPNQEIADLLKSWGLEAKLEVRVPGSRRFADIFLPELNLAIEYNGNYWHSSQYLDSRAHKVKTDECQAAGWRVVHIFSDEWRTRRQAVETLLKRICNVGDLPVYARHTEVVSLDKGQAAPFLDANHIQGASRTGEFVGLMHNGSLCAVMCFDHRTSNRSAKAVAEVVELTRYASSVQVLGGFSKLLKAYLRQHLEIQQVVSYSDNRLFSGKVYALAGFEKVHETSPDYKYLEPGQDDTLHHKSKYQKKHLLARFGAEACEGKTEVQITREQGIYQVYDCGKTKWVLTVPLTGK